MKSRAQQGICFLKKLADVHTIEQEFVLEQKGCLSMDSPQVLLNTLVYKIGLNLALRSGVEHRNLKYIPS